MNWSEWFRQSITASHITTAINWLGCWGTALIIKGFSFKWGNKHITTRKDDMLKEEEE